VFRTGYSGTTHTKEMRNNAGEVGAQVPG
jgi:hypothetical protein